MYTLSIAKYISHYESMSASNDSERRIQSLNRAFDILEAVYHAGSDGLSLKDICTATGINMSTAHHLANTMLARGYLDQEPRSRRYSLGPVLLELGAAALQRLDLQTVAVPIAQELCKQTEENVYV